MDRPVASPRETSWRCPASGSQLENAWDGKFFFPFENRDTPGGDGGGGGGLGSGGVGLDKGEEDDGDFQHLENDDIAGEEKSEENAEEEENIRPPAHMQSSDRRPW